MSDTLGRSDGSLRRISGVGLPFNGDGLEDVGVLIDQGKQCLLIIAQRVKGSATTA